MTERSPTPYEHRHPKRIEMLYTGIASDIMKLDDPIADEYMGIVDARTDVAIQKARPERVFDYDGSSDVLVAKMIHLPRLELPQSRSGHNFYTEFIDGTWVVSVDDQSLAREVVDNHFVRGEFDERFIDRFRETVNAALREVLKNEKLLNNGKYNKDFIVSQYFFLINDVFAIPAIMGILTLDGYPKEAVELGAVLYGEYNTFAHFLKLFLQDPHVDNPFMPRYLKRPWEILMPPVPVDKLVRGYLYLHSHGDELIEVER